MLNKWVLLIALVLSYLVGVPKVAAQDSQIFVSGDASTICNAPVVLELWVDHIPADQPLQAYDIRVAYDPGSVTATAEFDNNYFDTSGAIVLRNATCGPNIDYPVEDSCAFAVSQLLPSTVSGTATDPLATITLTKVGSAASSLQIYEYSGSDIAPTPKLSDLNGDAISHTIGTDVAIPACTTAIALDKFGFDSQERWVTPALFTLILLVLTVFSLVVYQRTMLQQ